MKILGMEKSSFIDYPNKVATVCFTPGCNFRCGYCHNSYMVKEEGEEISQEEVFAFLRKRKKFIDAVCISGGEPTLQKGLYAFILKIKQEGFYVKLDTNGTSPDTIALLLQNKLLDYIAMDIKAPFDRYEFVARTKVDIEAIKKSITIIKNSTIDYEFRTTVCKELHSKEDILEIAAYLKGSKAYFIQNFRDGETVLIGKNQFHPQDIKVLEEIEKEIRGYFESFKIRK
ncbi:anaerobic ribonucleoside-triphosphate reductase activating protein NrdG [Clostridium aceticum]|uniref:Anaerobic ribonucleoside-triphosphate reductase activating protein NrdG n=1 Tax=Clostridium aceticum TaxID=84022 RepID=A0A0D8I761_9CLOT|nr:anaerobic ribonucleoside-triphosphate reductase activating protein [Clostridium aceticum]AKL94284.1 anaerobic ribonucleoside-triphosphate reductase activating protein NrdG [Clostridium aceticum]KJF26130.1 ribonucleoside-triphosphate reductase activating protein [Clostridium aceticum]